MLSHPKNDLTFDFVGLHYGHPERNRYAYMLEGYDEARREAGTQRTATYTNLSPGRYGDVVVLMSNGLPELRGATGEMLGYERMPSLVAGAAGGSPEAVIAHLVGAAKVWSDGQVQEDDMTFVVMKVKDGV